MAFKRSGIRQRGTQASITRLALVGLTQKLTPGASALRSAPTLCLTNSRSRPLVFACTATRPTTRQPGSACLARKAFRTSTSIGDGGPNGASSRAPIHDSRLAFSSWFGTATGVNARPSTHWMLSRSPRCTYASAISMARLIPAMSSVRSGRRLLVRRSSTARVAASAGRVETSSTLKPGILALSWSAVALPRLAGKARRCSTMPGEPMVSIITGLPAVVASSRNACATCSGSTSRGQRRRYQVSDTELKPQSPDHCRFGPGALAAWPFAVGHVPLRLRLALPDTPDQSALGPDALGQSADARPEPGCDGLFHDDRFYSYK